jgi:hypothetical protein
MKPTSQHATFYGEVDRARYRANWSCLVWFFVVGLLLVAGGWLIARQSGWL